MVLGRLASEIAKVLRGKNKPEFTPHADCGDYVIVLNADKVVLSGDKWEIKAYDRYTGWMGGLKTTTVAQMLEKDATRIVEYAVKRMLPKNKLADKMMKKLKIYVGSEHPHQAHSPQPISFIIPLPSIVKMPRRSKNTAK
jgi:large subunit ribosomal protein L13